MNELEIFEKENLSLMQNYALFEKQLKQLKEEQENARKELLEAMSKYGVKGFDNDFISITVVAPSVSKSIDTKELRADDPDLYDELISKYEKTTNRKESLRVKIK